MSKKHKEAVQKQFAKTVEAFSKTAVRDTPEVVAEKVEFARPQPSDLALDVACGPGTLALALARRVRSARGIDLTEEMLRQAREFQREQQAANLFFDRGDAEQLPYPDAAFDLVTCECSLHHMAKPQKALAEMVRVMKPEGRLLIIDTLAPEGDARFELYSRIETLRDPSHAKTLKLTTFLSLFDDLGLALARQSFKRRSRSFNNWMKRAGVATADQRYNETRKLMEESIAGDLAGFSPKLQGDDILITHNEGIFLLLRKEAQPA